MFGKIPKIYTFDNRFKVSAENITRVQSTCNKYCSLANKIIQLQNKKDSNPGSVIILQKQTKPFVGLKNLGNNTIKTSSQTRSIELS